MAASGLTRLSVKNSALFLCDMQEKFRKTISFYPQIIAVSARMLAASKILKIPVIVTEQYPKGQYLEFRGVLKSFCIDQNPPPPPPPPPISR